MVWKFMLCCALDENEQDWYEKWNIMSDNVWYYRLINQIKMTSKEWLKKGSQNLGKDIE